MLREFQRARKFQEGKQREFQSLREFERQFERQTLDVF